ncbi:MAG: ferritin-like domain-containing protein [Saprospiraceae bacterium]|nr:ferritin-like domain-containing protein [Saprospiraceae bacterium]
MNFLQILNQVEEQEPEIFDRLDSRRKVIGNFVNFGKKLTLISLPFAISGMFQKAYGQNPGPAVLDVFNFALTLEYLEYRFYQQGVNASGLIPTGAPLTAITSIRDNELSHVNFLKTTITQLGGTPVPEPTFDFTGGNGTGNGPFSAVFSDYATFLAVAQVFEDTGVRAYKGQAGNLIGTNDLLEAALNIHSVEARHASHIRQMRKFNNFGDVKPWITGNDPGVGAANALVQASYNGEDNTVQATVNIVNIGGQSISFNAASESFDEPLSKTEVLAIVDPFIV